MALLPFRQLEATLIVPQLYRSKCCCGNAVLKDQGSADYQSIARI